MTWPTSSGPSPSWMRSTRWACTAPAAAGLATGTESCRRWTSFPERSVRALRLLPALGARCRRAGLGGAGSWAAWGRVLVFCAGLAQPGRTPRSRRPGSQDPSGSRGRTQERLSPSRQLCSGLSRNPRRGLPTVPGSEPDSAPVSGAVGPEVWCGGAELCATCLCVGTSHLTALPLERRISGARPVGLSAQLLAACASAPWGQWERPPPLCGEVKGSCANRGTLFVYEEMGWKSVNLRLHVSEAIGGPSSSW